MGDDYYLPIAGLCSLDMLQHRLELAAKMGTRDETISQTGRRALRTMPQCKDRPIGQPL